MVEVYADDDDHVFAKSTAPNDDDDDDHVFAVSTAPNPCRPLPGLCLPTRGKKTFLPQIPFVKLKLTSQKKVLGKMMKLLECKL